MQVKGELMSNNMIFLNLLLTLRQRLVNARELKDQASLSELLTTFGVLRDACESGSVNMILTDLTDAARDSLMGVDWKSGIPSIEAIRSALSPSETA